MKTQHAIVAPDNSGPPARTLGYLDPATQAAVRVFLTFIAESDLPPAARVLLYGSHAQGDNRADSDIDLAVVLLGDAPPRSERRVLRRKLSFLSSDAMLESLQPQSAVLLWESMLDEPDKTASSAFYHNVLTDGVEVSLRDDALKIEPKPAKAYIPSTGWSDHSLHDARSLALHTKIAWKISEDPSLLDKARENLTDMRSRYEPDDVPLYIDEWERILTLPWERVAAFLIAVTEDAIRLRSSSPFVGTLTQAERERIYEAFRHE